MKILPLAAVALWMIPLAARGQPEIGIALKGGPNAATLTGDHRVNKYGFSGGFAGSLREPLTSRFSIAGQMELLYTPRGTEVVVEGRYLGTVWQRYLDVMVLARPEARLGSASVYLLIGGGVNFLLSANQESASGAKNDLTDFLERRDVALLAGAGVELHLPPRKLGPFRLATIFLEARHDRGLIGTVTITGEAKNRNSSLMLGLSLALSSGSGDRSAGVPTSTR